MTDEPQAVRKTRNFADVIRAKLAADPELAAEVEALMEDQAPFIEEINRLHLRISRMTRMEKRAEVLPDYGVIPTCDVLNICQALHKDSMQADDPVLVHSEYVRFLRVCLETWEPNQHVSRYDEAVRRVVEAVLREQNP